MTTTEEKFFINSRRAIWTVSLLILLYDAGLSVFFNFILEGKNSSGHSLKLDESQHYGLRSFLFFWCLYTAIRYHQAFLQNGELIKLNNAYIDIRDTYLRRRGYLVDVIDHGHNSISGEEWNLMEVNDYYFHTIIEDDRDMNRIIIRPKRNWKNEITGTKYIIIRIKLFFLVLRALLSFTLHHPIVFNLLLPYLVAALALLEITGSVQVSDWMTHFGRYLQP